MSTEYTDIWTEKFQFEDLEKYNYKFFKRIEKNIKHRELIDFVKTYYMKEQEWCDFPIGPGRLFETIKPSKNKSYGFDFSDQFLNYNIQKGWKCEKRNLNDFKLPQKYNLITCTNTLFAFNNQIEILKNLSTYLKPSGVLIVDLVNKDHILATKEKLGEYEYHQGFKEEEIEILANQIGCTVDKFIYHDCYDNRNVVNLFNTYKNSRWFSRFYRALNKLYFSLELYPVFKFFRPKNRNAYSKYLVAFKLK